MEEEKQKIHQEDTDTSMLMMNEEEEEDAMDNHNNDNDNDDADNQAKTTTSLEAIKAFKNSKKVYGSSHKIDNDSTNDTNNSSLENEMESMQFEFHNDDDNDDESVATVSCEIMNEDDNDVDSNDDNDSNSDDNSQEEEEKSDIGYVSAVVASQDNDDDFHQSQVSSHSPSASTDKPVQTITNDDDEDSQEESNDDAQKSTLESQGLEHDNHGDDENEANDENQKSTLESQGQELHEENDNVNDSDGDDDKELQLDQDRPSSRDFRKQIRQIFYKLPDKDNITIGGFKKALEKSMKIEITKDEKNFMKGCLKSLLSAESESEADEDEEEQLIEDHSSNESDYDVKTPVKRKRKKKQKNESDAASTDDDETHSPVTRSKTKPRKTRTPSHLKIHQEMRRKKLLVEEKIRNEELQDAKEQKYNEEDQKRAQLIAKKFDTNTEEERIQRIEDRVGLLGRLKEKRLTVLAFESEYTKKKTSPVDASLSSTSQSQLTVDTFLGHLDNGKDIESSEAESSDDDNDDMELEIIGKDDTLGLNLKEDMDKSKVPVAATETKSPTSVFDFFSSKSSQSINNRSNGQNKMTVASFNNPRAALKKALRAKQFQNGNRWLANELGFDKSEDHIRSCKMMEKKKQKLVIAKEEESLRIIHVRNERLKAAINGINEAQDEIGDQDDGDDNQVRTLVNANTDQFVNENQVDNQEENEEEDEEMALAREIESERQEERQDNSSSTNDEEQEDLVYDGTQDELTLYQSQDIIHDASQKESHEDNGEPAIPNEEEKAFLDDESSLEKIDNEDTNDHDDTNSQSEIINEASDEASDERTYEEKDTTEGDINKDEKRPKNAAWRAMLEKEKEIAKKRKALRKNGQAIDDEAEEEEEEAVAGLEDFGFTVKSKQKGDDEEDEADEDDFENIVDDVSDGEGDEDAGEKGRQDLQAKEEKMQHKEMLRRIREGYDGRRGGVAGGNNRRGNLRFDQLVAADNRSDAKRLGLLNDDELDSDDEMETKGTGDGEVEDEAMLIDKLIKDRYLQRPQLPDENFSDSEDENENENNGQAANNIEDDEDKLQERLAKRFAKRARMNRLLDLHAGDKEFSQSRLLDEDEDLKRELTKIKTIHGKKVRQTSSSTTSTVEESNHSFSLLSSNGFQQNNKSKGILPFGSTLSLALSKNAQMKRRKTSFLGGSQNKNRSKSSIKTQAVSLGHVVFREENSYSNSNSAPKRAVSGGSSFADTSSRSSNIGLSKKRSISNGSNRGSLWSKVSAQSIQKRRKR